MTCELLGFINTDILKEGILVFHLVIAIPFCSRFCYKKYIYKAGMIQVYWCTCYDVPPCFHLVLFFISSEGHKREHTFTYNLFMLRNILS